MTSLSINALPVSSVAATGSSGSNPSGNVTLSATGNLPHAVNITNDVANECEKKQWYQDPLKRNLAIVAAIVSIVAIAFLFPPASALIAAAVGVCYPVLVSTTVTAVAYLAEVLVLTALFESDESPQSRDASRELKAKEDAEKAKKEAEKAKKEKEEAEAEAKQRLKDQLAITATNATNATPPPAPQTAQKKRRSVGIIRPRTASRTQASPAVTQQNNNNNNTRIDEHDSAFGGPLE